MVQRDQFDLFNGPRLIDLPLRDQRETMERPFFSLSKRKRLKPIDYSNGDGTVWVKVQPHQEFGMATIWDADILIWAISRLNAMRQRGVNDLPRTLEFHAHDLLKAIGRDTGGDQYAKLRESLDRLKTTAVQTNIRSANRKKTARFSWLDSWTETSTTSGTTKGMTLTLSDWLYNGVMQDQDLLAIDPRYFEITSAIGRVLYRLARKHAGDQTAGFTLLVETIYEKSGSDDRLASFQHLLKKEVEKNALPEYFLSWIKTETGKAAIHMVRRSKLDPNAPGYEWPDRNRRRATRPAPTN